MKFKKLISFITIACILVYLQGCATRHLVTPQELDKLPAGPITITTTDGEVFEFIEGWVVISDTLITGTLKDGTAKDIPFSQVKMVGAGMSDELKTCLVAGSVTAGVVVGLVLIGLYSFIRSF